MAPVSVRLLPYALADGANNMAADEVLLASAGQGGALLRYYGWSVPTVSLGYFQPETVRRQDPNLAELPYVRRPSGGALLVHHHELTYALALPADQVGPTAAAWLHRMHSIIAVALGELGVKASLHAATGREQFQGALCFHHFAPGDVLLGPAKIVGSAQRRHRCGLMQHGAILLAMSPHTPSLHGISELTRKQVVPLVLAKTISAAFQEQTAWQVEEATWTESERQAIAELVADKYTQNLWNARR
jgi:lipoate-protein ligase A